MRECTVDIREEIWRVSAILESRGKQCQGRLTQMEPSGSVFLIWKERENGNGLMALQALGDDGRHGRKSQMVAEFKIALLSIGQQDIGTATTVTSSFILSAKFQV